MNEELPKITSYLGLNGGFKAHWWSDSGWTGCLFPTNTGFASNCDLSVINTTYSKSAENTRNIIYDRINIDTSKLGSPFNGTSVKPCSINARYFIKY